MRTAIVGSRDWKDEQAVKMFVEMLPKDSVVVSGGAKGVDTWAEKYALENGLATTVFLPDWNTHGKSAGILRNLDIVKNSDAVVAFWDGVSKGTRHTIDTALRSDNIKQILIIKE